MSEQEPPASPGTRKRSYQPTGQRGYQPQVTGEKLDPMKLTPPKGGSAVQPPPSARGDESPSKS